MADEGSRLLDLILEYGGPETADKFLQGYGGVTVSLPAYAPTDHWLVDLVGRESAEKILSEFRILSPEGRGRGMEVQPPLRWRARRALLEREVKELILKGYSGRIIALRLGISLRTVRRYSVKLRKSRRVPRAP